MAYDHNSIHQQGSSSSGSSGRNLEMMNSLSCWVEEEFFTTLNDSSKTYDAKKTKGESSSSSSLSSSRHAPQQHYRSIQDISMDLHDILQEMQDEETEEQESRDDAHLSDAEIGSISISNDSGMSMDSVGIAVGIGIGMRLNESSSSSSSLLPHPTKQSQLQPQTAQDMSLDLQDILQELQEKGTRTDPEGTPTPPHELPSTKQREEDTTDPMDILNPLHPHNRSSLDLDSVHWESFLLEHFHNNNSKEWQSSSKPLLLPNPIPTNAKTVRFKTLETVHRY